MATPTFKLKTEVKKLDGNEYVNVSIAGTQIKNGTIFTGNEVKHLQLIGLEEYSNLKEVDPKMRYVIRGQFNKNKTKTYIVLVELETGRRSLVNSNAQYTYKQIEGILSKVQNVWNEFYKSRQENTEIGSIEVNTEDTL